MLGGVDAPCQGFANAVVEELDVVAGNAGAYQVDRLERRHQRPLVSFETRGLERHAGFQGPSRYGQRAYQGKALVGQGFGVELG